MSFILLNYYFQLINLNFHSFIICIDCFQTLESRSNALCYLFLPNFFLSVSSLFFPSLFLFSVSLSCLSPQFSLPTPQASSHRLETGQQCRTRIPTLTLVTSRRMTSMETPATSVSSWQNSIPGLPFIKASLKILCDIIIIIIRKRWFPSVSHIPSVWTSQVSPVSLPFSQ